MAKLDAAAWDQIRRLYETSDLSVREIAKRYGTSEQAIFYRRRNESWPKRSLTTPATFAAAAARHAGADAAAQNPADPHAENQNQPPAAIPAPRRGGIGARFGRPVGGAALSRKAVVDRMVRLVERNLERMEISMEAELGRECTASDQERSVRAVGALVSTFEKVTELKTPDDDAAATAALDSAATAELRRELAERLYRMWGGAKA